VKQKTVLWDVNPRNLPKFRKYPLLLSSSKRVIHKDKVGYRRRQEIKSTTQKTEGVCSSETPVISYRTTRRHVPEESTLHVHCHENLLTCCIHWSPFLGTIPVKIIPVHTKYYSALFSDLQIRNIAKLILDLCPAAFTYLNIVI
jgi:hypothetical protein